MIPSKNLPLLLNLAYSGYNRGLGNTNGTRGDFEPVFNADGSVHTTYCNLFIQYVCGGFGYDEFDGKTANEMHQFMEKAENGWISVADGVAQAHANSGVIVLASKSNESGHGHVCLILPGIMEKSWSWNKSVPKCVNIGKDVFFGKKVSFAFTAENQPQYFALSGMI